MSQGEALPFWILASGPGEPLAVDVRVNAEGLTAEKLQQLRSALAAFADDPPVTLERYELPAGTITGGHTVALGAPILQHLAQIIGPKVAAPAGTPAGGETLYRMVVDQRIAGQLAQGLASSSSTRSSARLTGSAITSQPNGPVQFPSSPSSRERAGRRPA